MIVLSFAQACNAQIKLNVQFPLIIHHKAEGYKLSKPTMS